MPIPLKKLHDLLRIIFPADGFQTGDISRTIRRQRVLVKRGIVDEPKSEFDAHSRGDFFHGRAASVYGFMCKLIVHIIGPLDDGSIP